MCWGRLPVSTQTMATKATAKSNTHARMHKSVGVLLQECVCRDVVVCRCWWLLLSPFLADSCCRLRVPKLWLTGEEVWWEPEQGCHVFTVRWWTVCVVPQWKHIYLMCTVIYTETLLTDWCGRSIIQITGFSEVRRKDNMRTKNSITWYTCPTSVWHIIQITSTCEVEYVSILCTHPAQYSKAVWGHENRNGVIA